MKISIITPTDERAHFLKGLYTLLKKQTTLDWQWLIYDTSLHPTSFSDKRVSYFHETAILSVGEKRNRLIERATGDVIVHCDDDDYYAPSYLAKIGGALKEHDFFNIHSWFSYQMPLRQFYYWDTDEETKSRFVVDPITEMQVREIDFGPHFASNDEHLNIKGKKGYGFSFAYHKNVWKKSPFPDLDLSEDRLFYDDALQNGFKIFSTADTEGLVVHLVHTSNLSKVYPQYRIPHFVVKPLFPDFFAYLDHLNEN